MKKFYVFGRIEAGDGFGFDDFKTIIIFPTLFRQTQKIVGNHSPDDLQIFYLILKLSFNQ